MKYNFSGFTEKANEALNKAGQGLGNVVISMTYPQNIEELSSKSKK